MFLFHPKVNLDRFVHFDVPNSSMQGIGFSDMICWRISAKLWPPNV